jgi:hypothetical protein
VASRADWRDLAGAGPSRVGVSGAARARDIDRPSAADLAEAEASLVIVRRAPDAGPGNAQAAQRGSGSKPRRNNRRRTSQF